MHRGPEWLLLAAATCAGAASASPPPSADPDDTTGILDAPAPPWQVSAWFNSPPLTLADLRGKVVFVRWFMDPTCPMCSGTAPALRALHERYAARGLVVIGMYHHKAEAPLDPEQVRGWVRHFGYRFPVAIDADWATLKRWWLDGHPHRSYTSVSFLIDAGGIVRYVHKGGLIDPKGAELRAIERRIEELLAQR
jgi:peroxiredoxin